MIFFEDVTRVSNDKKVSSFLLCATDWKKRSTTQSIELLQRVSGRQVAKREGDSVFVCVIQWWDTIWLNGVKKQSNELIEWCMSFSPYFPSVSCLEVQVVDRIICFMMMLMIPEWYVSMCFESCVCSPFHPSSLFTYSFSYFKQK